MSIKTLNIIDFDGTLFRSPSDTPENRKLYEKATGLPWLISKHEAGRLSKRLGRPVHPRRGWWGRPETLLPPLVPDPVPDSMWIKDTLNTLLESIQDPSIMNLIVTGRHVGLKMEVLRILHEVGFAVFSPMKKENRYEWAWQNNFHLYLLGMNGPCPEKVETKPQETLAWKVWLIEQYRLTYPEIEKIEIWEDREDHITKFKALGDIFPEDVVIHQVAN